MKISIVSYLSQRQILCTMGATSLKHHLRANKEAFQQYPEHLTFMEKREDITEEEKRIKRKEYLNKWCEKNNTWTYTMSAAQIRLAEWQIQRLEHELEEIEVLSGILENDDELCTNLKKTIVDNFKAAGVEEKDITSSITANFYDQNEGLENVDHLYITILRYLSHTENLKDFNNQILNFYDATKQIPA